MTKSLTYLAISSRQSYVALTKCGTIHLNWQGQQIHLHPHRFRRLVRLLDESVQRNQAGDLRDGGICLLRGDDGDYHLTVGAFGLHVASGHLNALTQMVQDACHWCPPAPTESLQMSMEPA